MKLVRHPTRQDLTDQVNALRAQVAFLQDRLNGPEARDPEARTHADQMEGARNLAAQDRECVTAWATTAEGR